ncbi:MAG: hypothetical protein G01um10145_679 [Microgenomates group bacterium Gr01-1014_5]|nr:MAG: hypothetical protein G01um10145_679 [Microgenomates group bacterium Gr01-1014_5]
MSFFRETISRISSLISGKDSSTPRLPIFDEWRDGRNIRSRGDGTKSLRSAFFNGAVNTGDMVEINTGTDMISLEFHRPVILENGEIGYIFKDDAGNQCIKDVILAWRKV